MASVSMKGQDDDEAQWASVDRRKGSTATFVATRSFTHQGVRFTAGLTRVPESHPWLADPKFRSAFDGVESTGGRAAIRSRAGVSPTRVRKYDWQLP